MFQEFSDSNDLDAHNDAAALDGFNRWYARSNDLLTKAYKDEPSQAVERINTVYGYCISLDQSVEVASMKVTLAEQALKDFKPHRTWSSIYPKKRVVSETLAAFAIAAITATAAVTIAAPLAVPLLVVSGISLVGTGFGTYIFCRNSLKELRARNKQKNLSKQLERKREAYGYQLGGVSLLRYRLLDIRSRLSDNGLAL